MAKCRRKKERVRRNKQSRLSIIAATATSTLSSLYTNLRLQRKLKATALIALQPLYTPQPNFSFFLYLFIFTTLPIQTCHCHCHIHNGLFSKSKELFSVFFLKLKFSNSYLSNKIRILIIINARVRNCLNIIITAYVNQISQT